MITYVPTFAKCVYIILLIFKVAAIDNFQVNPSR